MWLLSAVWLLVMVSLGVVAGGFHVREWIKRARLRHRTRRDAARATEQEVDVRRADERTPVVVDEQSPHVIDVDGWEFVDNKIDAVKSASREARVGGWVDAQQSRDRSARRLLFWLWVSALVLWFVAGWLWFALEGFAPSVTTLGGVLVIGLGGPVIYGSYFTTGGCVARLRASNR